METIIKSIKPVFDAIEVSFNRDVGYLKAGATIQVQLSDDITGSREDAESYAQSTLGQASAILKSAYTLEQLSIMLIIGSVDIKHVVFKTVQTTETAINEGRIIGETNQLTIMQDNDCYRAVTLDDFYFADKVWIEDDSFDWCYDSSDLEQIFHEPDAI